MKTFTVGEQISWELCGVSYTGTIAAINDFPELQAGDFVLCKIEGVDLLVRNVTT